MPEEGSIKRPLIVPDSPGGEAAARVRAKIGRAVEAAIIQYNDQDPVRKKSDEAITKPASEPAGQELSSVQVK